MSKYDEFYEDLTPLIDDDQYYHDFVEPFEDDIEQQEYYEEYYDAIDFLNEQDMLEEREMAQHTNPHTYPEFFWLESSNNTVRIKFGNNELNQETSNALILWACLIYSNSEDLPDMAPMDTKLLASHKVVEVLNKIYDEELRGGQLQLGIFERELHMAFLDNAIGEVNSQLKE